MKVIFQLKLKKTFFDFNFYKTFLSENIIAIKKYRDQQISAFKKEIKSWKNNQETNKIFIEKPAIKISNIDIKNLKLVSVYSNMNGNIWKILVQLGDKVLSGQILVIMEVMKIELKIVVPKS
ncbi:acetyl-CoA carboxylase biotin carboxyl carrier protein subunit [Candidatus Pantoea edessiphila]|uniref:acetyl-CoA carboxylase biotin carboxyl carrier protein subunit n=1 Tax=Candidatus Pantoea edessiphila TaxID=2044610 RepID=UPI001F546DBC